MLAPLDSAKRNSASTSPPAKPSFAPPLVHYPSSNVSTYSAANRSDTVGRKRKEPMPAPLIGDTTLYSRPCVRDLHDQAHDSIFHHPLLSLAQTFGFSPMYCMFKRRCPIRRRRLLSFALPLSFNLMLHVMSISHARYKPRETHPPSRQPRAPRRHHLL